MSTSKPFCYTKIVLDTNDEKTIDKISFNQVFQALQDIVLPRFDSLDSRLDKVESRLDNVENRLESVENKLVEVDEHLLEIDQELVGVKYRLGEVEKKVEIPIDAAVEIKFMNGRLTKLESAILK